MNPHRRASHGGAAVGDVAGLVVGLVITVVVIAAKIGFFINAPRAAHPLILIAFFAVAAGTVSRYWRVRA